MIIIDEIDNLSKTESTAKFIQFLYGLINSDANTTIIGIANSVDLLSKIKMAKED